eukprot:Gb_26630 [translate_table: standard]
MSKANGGLGIIDIRAQRVALVGKWMVRAIHVKVPWQARETGGIWHQDPFGLFPRQELDYEIQEDVPKKLIRSTIDDWKRNLETLVQWSPYSSEADLLLQVCLLSFSLHLHAILLLLSIR